MATLDLTSALIGSGLTVTGGALTTLLTDWLQRRRDDAAYLRTFRAANVERLRRLYTAVLVAAEAMRDTAHGLQVVPEGQSVEARRRLFAEAISQVLADHNKVIAELRLEPDTNGVLAQSHRVWQAYLRLRGMMMVNEELARRNASADHVQDEDAALDELDAAFADLITTANKHLASVAPAQSSTGARRKMP